MSLVIQGGWTLTQAGDALLPADVMIEGDRIAGVGQDLTVPDGAEVLDAAGKIIVPGLINAHTHGHNNLTRGAAGSWTLEEMLTHGPALLAGRTPEEQYLSTMIGAIEMLKSGCTACYDLFMGLPAPTDESVEAVVRAYADVGMRAVVAPAVADIVFHQTVPDLFDLLPDDLAATVHSIEAAPTTGLLRLTEQAIRRWHGTSGGRITVGVSPTIPGQCTDEFLTGCLDLVRNYGVSLHTHLAETKVQVIHALRRWGKTPAAHLADLGLISSGFIGAHGVWLMPEEIDLLSTAGATVAHNPASNLKLGSGIAPVREMLDAGLNVALGTDGSMSSDNQNMFEAMRFGALVGRVRFPHDSSRWLGAEHLWSAATTAGARALGMSDDLGVIGPNSRADLVLLDAASVALRPLNHPANALVYRETGDSVDTVIVDGRVVVQQGRVLTVDEDDIRARAETASERLRAANDDAWLLAGQLLPYVSAACSTAVAQPLPINRYAAPVG